VMGNALEVIESRADVGQRPELAEARRILQDLTAGLSNEVAA
jgi:hypothetical protein